MMHRNFLLDISLRPETADNTNVHPFDIPSIAQMGTLRFDKPVTFFIGENGSGKSTLIEAIAILMRYNPEGGSRDFTFATAQAHGTLHNHLRYTRSQRRQGDGFFLRAESYFNLASEVDRLDLQDSYGGKSLHAQSHGESFFALLEHRLRGDGLYILDEPEAALSPTRQMTMLTRLHQLVQDGCQFLIATHSPILMAYPDADIYLMGEGAPKRTGYTDTEHYRITRHFLTRTDAMLEILLRSDEASSDA